MRNLRLRLAHRLPGRWQVISGSEIVDVAFLSRRAAWRRANDYVTDLAVRTGRHDVPIQVIRA